MLTDKLYKQMIRLNFHCSLIPNTRQTKPVSNHGSFIIQNHRASKFSQRVTIKLKAIKGEMNGETSGSSGGSWDPGLEIEVPFEQRPVCVNNCVIVAIIGFILNMCYSEFHSSAYIQNETVYAK